MSTPYMRGRGIGAQATPVNGSVPPVIGRRVAYNGNNAEELLSQISDSDRAEYEANYRPVNQRLIESVNSTELVDLAKERSGVNDAATAERQKRMSLRFGMGGSALDKSRSSYTSGLARGADADGLINDSRIDQYERNVGMRDQMIQLGRGIATSSTNSLSNAAAGENATRNANSNAAAQNTAQNMQMAGSVVSTAIMAAMLL